jgi:PEP-CTERM motif-containing protein
VLNRLTSGLVRPAMITCALTAVALPQMASAQVYTGTFTPLNGSGVSGTTTLTLNADAKTLEVMINAIGLEPGVPHVGHIHGLVNSAGLPVNSTTPTIAQDTDHDGFVELAEGLVTYGPILVPFGNTDPDMDGVVNFDQIFNLLDPATYAPGFDITSLLGAGLNELQLREIVLHGMTVPPGPGTGTAGEVNGTNGFLAVLPVASAEIMRSGAVPEPASWALMLLGFGAIGVSIRRDKSKKALRSAA